MYFKYVFQPLPDFSESRRMLPFTSFSLFDFEPDEIQPFSLVALHDEAVVAYKGKTAYKLMKINTEQKIDRWYRLTEDSPVVSLLYLEPWIFIIQANGTITKIQKDLSDAQLKHVSLRGMQQIQSADLLDNDTILLLTKTGEVWLYKAEEEAVRLIKDGIPTGQLTVGSMRGSRVYIITDARNCRLQMYDQDWQLLEWFNAQLLLTPCWSCVLPGDRLLVADTYRHCISEYNLNDGKFVNDIVSISNTLTQPISIDVQDSKLWVLSAKKKIGYFDIQ